MSDEIIKALQRVLAGSLTPAEVEGLRRLFTMYEQFEAAPTWWPRTPQYIARYLQDLGYEVTREEVAALVRLRGQITARLLQTLDGRRLAAEMARAFGRPLGTNLFELLGSYEFMAMLGGMLVLALIVGIAIYLNTRPTEAVRQVASIPFCDCTKISAGLLTKDYQATCRSREKELRELAQGCGNNVSCVEQKLHLKVGPDNTFTDGEFCQATDLAAGPQAWPELGGAVDPPAVVREEKPCESTSGISRECK